MVKKIRKGDLVVVLTGKDKGKQGSVLFVDFESQKVLVSGINLVKKHVKPNPMKGVEGGFLSKEMPLHISNVALFNAQSQRADRVGFSLVDGEKVRIFRSSSQPVAQ
jgi:large subunit ribosomal protein L24